MPDTLLGFDYGLRHIGVAYGQTLTQSARPLATLKARDGIPDWDEVGRLITEWLPQRLVVGLPLNMDGTPSDMSERARKFSRRLNGRFNLPVELHDERLSSFEARGELLADGQREFREGGVDALSAALILESWMRQADTPE